MKKFRGISLVAGVAALGLTLSGCAAPEELTPTETTEAAAEETTAPLITVAWNDIASDFNTSSAAGNNVSNSIPAYLSGSGFNYYDNSPALVKNTEFGTYELVSEDPMTVTYTINDAVVWSDGTPIDGADMLLSWAAMFGYGKDAEGNYLFQHAAPREDLASKLPTVDGKTLSFEYDIPYVDWELQFGIGVSAHGTVMMAYPEITDPAEAKAKLIEAIQGNDLEWLKAVADVWNTGYQHTDTPENPLVTLSSGPYMVEELVADQYITMVQNPLYTWGPKPKYERITIREIADSTAAIQAVENGEVQIASGQPTADVLALVQALTNASYETGDEAAYEHIDLTTNNGGPFDPASYGGDAEKARKVRQAFLLSIPREQILENLIKPLNANASLRNSILLIPGSPNYEAMVAESGVADYLGTDAENLEKAKALLAEAGVSGTIDVEFWYPEGNVRRGQQFELIAANAALAGFNLIDESEPDWMFTDPSVNPTNPHDAVIFAWAATSLAVTGNDQQYGTGKPSNFSGYSNAKVDALLEELNSTLDPARQFEIQLAVEQEMWKDAYSITIFQFPGLAWWETAVDGVSLNPLVPYYFWNFWDWTPTAG
ncbi:ABC transporter family substrate-binding protein [Aquiluna borgnonia]|uniref:ABC transporter family substrate-binding protein n=1 Tax=Aquiluna borgnonia TaxID=2499157 RepID=A0A7D4UJU4_9MICO|nr:ABC transporter family substrate-binding protein [Aquiluna borgnonia]QKJ25039.1 ABC transporter family substrate-binding protein [Aquiluna borgnonia]